MFNNATFSSNIIFLNYTKSCIISIHIFKIDAYNNINSFSKIVYCYIFTKYYERAIPNSIKKEDILTIIG